MKNWLERNQRRMCEVLAAIAVIFFFATKDLDQPYDKVIMAEGHGYYAYLPAVFIYDDLSFEFFNTVHPKYYLPDYSPPTRNFILEVDGTRLNKYFPGVSLLWLPFFLLAHALALLLHLPADGYSPVYQYAIGIAGLFYTWLGLRFTRRLLMHFKLSAWVQWVSLAAILFGSNLFLYAASWSSQSHPYSFFLLAGFCWTMVRLFDPAVERKDRLLGMAFAWLALLFTVRPQDILIVAVLPTLGFRLKEGVTLFRSHLFSLPALIGLLAAVLVVGRVCTYWYLQTGHWVLQPYHGEGYYFSEPHIADILFSYRKGWLLYSPLLIFGLAGLFFARSKKVTVNLLLFWALLIYISSCWWCWTYSPSSFGQRPFIDFYCLLTLQLGFFLRFLEERRWKSVAAILLSGGVALNILQTHQYRTGIIPGEFGSAETFWPNLFAIHPLAYYPVPMSAVRSYADTTRDFEEQQVPSLQPWKGHGCTWVNGPRAYSDNIVAAVPPFSFGNRYSHIRVSAMIRSKPQTAGSESLVLDFKRNGQTVNYTAYNLGEFVRNEKWKRMQFGREIPPEVQPGDSVLVYLWRSDAGNPDTTRMDDLRVEFLTTDSSLDFVKPGDRKK